VIYFWPDPVAGAVVRCRRVCDLAHERDRRGKPEPISRPAFRPRGIRFSRPRRRNRCSPLHRMRVLAISSYDTTRNHHRPDRTPWERPLFDRHRAGVNRVGWWSAAIPSNRISRDYRLREGLTPSYELFDCHRAYWPRPLRSEAIQGVWPELWTCFASLAMTGRDYAPSLAG